MQGARFLHGRACVLKFELSLVTEAAEGHHTRALRHSGFPVSAFYSVRVTDITPVVRPAIIHRSCDCQRGPVQLADEMSIQIVSCSWQGSGTDSSSAQTALQALVDDPAGATAPVTLTSPPEHSGPLLLVIRANSQVGARWTGAPPLTRALAIAPAIRVYIRMPLCPRRLEQPPSGSSAAPAAWKSAVSSPTGALAMWAHTGAQPRPQTPPTHLPRRPRMS